jgi:hypothetical protein
MTAEKMSSLFYVMIGGELFSFTDEEAARFAVEIMGFIRGKIVCTMGKLRALSSYIAHVSVNCRKRCLYDVSMMAFVVMALAVDRAFYSQNDGEGDVE